MRVGGTRAQWRDELQPHDKPEKKPVHPDGKRPRRRRKAKGLDQHGKP